MTLLLLLPVFVLANTGRCFRGITWSHIVKPDSDSKWSGRSSTTSRSSQAAILGSRRVMKSEAGIVCDAGVSCSGGDSHILFEGGRSYGVVGLLIVSSNLRVIREDLRGIRKDNNSTTAAFGLEMESPWWLVYKNKQGVEAWVHEINTRKILRDRY
ncbi:uncharacterized protein F4812DRAFT_320881 [Daldinia caldariorum]|uniref:uncharacterized protein n=1 Tax=Daldinia caldariorum TaxID=326644 RepID=UPI0020082654|nr:uncharacterized protein F4812DRAFT_320881 [Daldinia caldariorum]KAI1469174.1 hypothetical protein F4812DRAFT_320881 [Daldinia caldariorum]